jgi:hypothetical protein
MKTHGGEVFKIYNNHLSLGSGEGLKTIKIA